MPTPAPASSQTGWPNAGRAGPSPHGVATTAATIIAPPRRSMLASWPSFAIRWPRTMYTMNSAQLAKAKTKPSGWPVMRIEVMATTLAVVSARAAALRRERVPAAEDCYFMKVYLHSIEDLEAILDLFTPHGRTTTSIVHSAPVPPRPLPVPGPGI
jgi:hypothetical protein